MIDLGGSAGSGVRAKLRVARLAGWLVGAMVIALFVSGTLGAGKAWAESLTVDNTNDSGSGSLRNAIETANTNGEFDTITFDLPPNSTIVLTGAELEIEDDVVGADLRIEGPGADQLTVDGDGNARVFLIAFDFSSGVGAEATIEGLTISGGAPSGGGGGILSRGTLTVNNSTVSNNTADGSGGGIFNFRGTLLLNNSTVSNNAAAGNGGGIYSSTSSATNTVPDPTDRTTITNSTISGNTADARDGSVGGGVYNNNGLTIIEYTTITDNSAPEGDGAGVLTFGDDDTRTEVGSSIIAGNTTSDVDYLVDTVVIPFVTLGYNVIGDGEGAEDFNGPNDTTGIDDPLLGPLANNSGPTRTHALQNGSPAIDRVAQAVCPPPNADQRGVSRPQGPRCDSGSFEKEVTPPPAKANLSLTKKASKSRPTVGQKLTYTLRVKNNGPDRATRVKIVDTLPKGVKVLSTSKGCRKLSARKVRCNIARLGDGRNVAKKIRVKVNRSGKLVNKARASSSVRDPNGRNNGARAVVRAKAKAAPRFKQISCRVKDPTVRLVQGKQVVVADRKPGKSVACVIQGNQLALARALKNQNLGLVKQGGKQVRAAKGKVIKSGARKVVVRVPRSF